jgi:hypothetical protein
MLSSVFTAVAMVTAASAHIVMSYPGWRGNNLITNETYPYGMQWEYPCKYMSQILVIVLLWQEDEANAIVLKVAALVPQRTALTGP